jgi:hypothetical protein
MIVLPQIFEEKLKLDTSGYYVGAVNTTRSKFSQVFSENQLYFFEEYTDHGIRHINSVLAACANLITPDTYKLLSEKDISILVLSVFLHDLGMHLQPLTFKKMITGGYDDVLNADFGDQKWSVLWENYLFEAKKFNDQQRNNVFGDTNVYVTEPDLNNPDSLTGIHRKLIGEFIRRHHPRIAFEVAFKGLTTHEETQIDFCADFDDDHKLMAGLLARSHGMHIRDTFSILTNHFARAWKRPFDIHIIYLMALLRLADYFQIDSKRVLKVPYLTRQFRSPVSFAEHRKHLQTKHVQPLDEDPETLYITAAPESSTYFLALENLFNDIQQEVDHSWAVLGEVYGMKSYDEQPKLAYRRVRSNLEDKKGFETKVPYIPEKISFTVDKEIPKLLIKPLYNSDPSFGVRELLQNAVDACLERDFYERKNDNKHESKILVKIEMVKGNYVFSITDNGKGMTLDEIRNYFLKVGGSFRKSPVWQSEHLDSDGHSNINKSGRFGIGVLAAYLLGSEIEVKTKSIFSTIGYSFKTTLEQGQIEITKEKNLPNGTTITIIISEDQYGTLISNRNVRNDHYDDALRFDKWFVLGYPFIAYEVPGKALEREVDDHFLDDHFPNLDEEDFYWHEVIDKDFKKIAWSYDNKFEKTIVCNGFVIPDYYGLVDERLYAPTLMIFDHDAKLPINLSRTKVDHPLQFNKQLETEIYKDIIAMLLTNDVENIFITQNINLKHYKLNHPAFFNSYYENSLNYIVHDSSYIIFSKAGFYLNIRNFLTQLAGKNYLKIFMRGNEKNFNGWLNKESIFNNADVDLVSFAKSDVRERNLPGLLIDMGRYYFTSKEKTIMGCTPDLYSGLSIVEQNRVKLTRDIQKEFIKEKNRDVSMVYFKYKTHTCKEDLLGKLLSYYLGDDLLIPYNFEDREKKFPQAFKELEPYMREYL